MGRVTSIRLVEEDTKVEGFPSAPGCGGERPAREKIQVLVNKAMR